MQNPADLLEITLIATSYNEEKSVVNWCQSLLEMSALPSQIVIVDALSNDNTVKLIKKALSGYQGDLKIIETKCNISNGRNIAVDHSTNEYICTSDFGVKFDQYWLKNIYNAIEKSDWVGGSYRLEGNNRIQSAYSNLFNKNRAYFESEKFLPSSRSFGFRRSVFIQSGGYNQSLVIGEDTDLVLRLRDKNFSYTAAPDACVHWQPRENLKEIFIQHFKYSLWGATIGHDFQNIIRLLLVLIFPLLLSIIIDKILNINIAPILFLCLFSFSLWLRCSINTIKSNKKRFANFDEFLVFTTYLFSILIGYLFGICRRIFVK